MSLANKPRVEYMPNSRNTILSDTVQAIYNNCKMQTMRLSQVAQDNQLSLGIEWEKKFEEYKNFFKMPSEQIQESLEKHKAKTLRKDREIADIASTEPEVICVVRCMLELYDWLEHQRIRESEKNEASCLSEAKILKGLLVEKESGQTDFGITELQRKIQKTKPPYQSLAAEEKPIIMEDRILADVEMKEGAGYKEALQNSLIVKEATTHSVASVSSNPKAKLVNEKLHESSGKLKEENSSTEDSPQDSHCEIKPKGTKAEINGNLGKRLLTDNKSKKKMKKKIAITIWDIPNGARANQIRRCLNYYGKAVVKSFMANGKSKAAFVEIEAKDDVKALALKEAWAIHFEEGKLVRITQGTFDKHTLIERSQFKLIAKKIPRSAIESALLRQLRGTKAKAVYISSNRNKNQREVATVYFESEADREKALKETVYYYNSKLEWAVLEGDKPDQKKLKQMEKKSSRKPLSIKRGQSPDQKSSKENLDLANYSVRAGKESAKEKRSATEPSSNPKAQPTRKEPKSQAELIEEILQRLIAIEERHQESAPPNFS